MTRLRHILLFIALLASFVAAFWVFSTLTAGILTDGPRPFGEAFSFSQATFESYNPDSLLINVKWLRSFGNNSETIVITEAIVKDSNGTVVALVSLPQIELPPQTEKTLTFSTQRNLPQGNYTVALVTARGGVYVSPTFTKP